MYDSVPTAPQDGPILLISESFELKVETRNGAARFSSFVGSQTRIDLAIAIVHKVSSVSSVSSEEHQETGPECGLTAIQGDSDK